MQTSNESTLRPQVLCPLSQSRLWGWVARYFREKGVAAWREDEVPHYVTNNPVVAACYAEMVFAALLDLRRMGRWPSLSGQPLYVCELGAGTGRLAFHFLRRLTALCENAGLGPRAFRYVLTDQVQANLDFWRAHPRLQRFFRAGVLDTALFDAGQDEAPQLQHRGGPIAHGGLELPLVAIANYVFDGLPQDLLYLDAGRAWQCEVSLAVRGEHDGISAAELLERMQMRFERRALATGDYPEAWLGRMIDGYRCALADTHLLLPVGGLRCLQRLESLTTSGLVLLAADKGTHRLMDLQGRPEPRPVRHGSISLDVNFHAFKTYCELRGGMALFPAGRHASLDIAACLVMGDAGSYRETRRAYERNVEHFGPDDFLTLARHAHLTLDAMGTREVLACLRLGRHDAHQCARYIPRLRQLAPHFSREDRAAVAAALDDVWDAYYPLGEETDLAGLIAQLLHEMHDDERALAYLARSAPRHGTAAGASRGLS
jgi:hypothetical protein